MTPLDPLDWSKNSAYLHGIELFNDGSYWEAHEVWEGLWKLAGRHGPLADFLKGLIKLAAAGVKLQKNVPAGVVSHASRATQLFELTRQAVGDGYCGFSLSILAAHGRDLAARANSDAKSVGFVLKPHP